MHCSDAVRRAVPAQRLLAHHKGMPRHSDKNSSTLREDVTSWCNSGVGQMTALDPELSNAPLAMKTEFCELNLETLRELQSRVSATGATVSSSAASNDNRIMWRHQPVCQPPSSPASSCALCTSCSSDAIYSSASGRISTRMEATFNRETNYR